MQERLKSCIDYRRVYWILFFGSAIIRRSSQMLVIPLTNWSHHTLLWFHAIPFPMPSSPLGMSFGIVTLFRG